MKKSCLQIHKFRQTRLTHNFDSDLLLPLTFFLFFFQFLSCLKDEKLTDDEKLYCEISKVWTQNEWLPIIWKRKIYGCSLQQMQPSRKTVHSSPTSLACRSLSSLICRSFSACSCNRFSRSSWNRLSTIPIPAQQSNTVISHSVVAQVVEKIATKSLHHFELIISSMSRVKTLNKRSH